jgi:hypothetical protein
VTAKTLGVCATIIDYTLSRLQLGTCRAVVCVWGVTHSLIILALH